MPLEPFRRKEEVDLTISFDKILEVKEANELFKVFEQAEEVTVRVKNVRQGRLVPALEVNG